MKQFKFFAVALAALTIFSCSKEQIGGNEGEGGNDGGNAINTPTYATFKFNIGGGSNGRAAADFDPVTKPEDDIDDAEIGRLQLLIFNATSQALEFNGVLDAGSTSKTVLLTAGKKKIFFIANNNELTEYNTAIAPATFKPGQATSTLNVFNELHFDAGTPQQISPDHSGSRTFNFSKLYSQSNIAVGSEAGLPMSNTNEMTYTLNAGVSESDAQGGVPVNAGASPTNTFKIQLYYMVAKARLVLGSDVLIGGPDKPEISDVKYAIRNLARATSYVQNVPTAGSYQSFYYSMTFADQAAFEREFDNASSINVPTSVIPGHYLYVPENNHMLLLRGQSSYFGINATFEPVVISKVEYDINNRVKYTMKRLFEAANGNRDYIYTTKDVQGIPAGTYFKTVALFQEAAWMMKSGIPFVEATHREEAKLLVKDPASTKPTIGGDYMSFTDAQSYYRIDLGVGTGAETIYGVLRSNKYDATVNKITGPGVPSEEDLVVDPENPVSARTYISATIIPAVWNPITQSADL